MTEAAVAFTYEWEFPTAVQDLKRAAITAWMFEQFAGKSAGTLCGDYSIDLDGPAYRIQWEQIAVRYVVIHKVWISTPGRDGSPGGDVVRTEGGGSPPDLSNLAATFHDIQASIDAVTSPWGWLPDPDDFTSSLDSLSDITNVFTLGQDRATDPLGGQTPGRGRDRDTLGGPSDKIATSFLDAFHGGPFNAVKYNFTDEFTATFLELADEVTILYAHLAIEPALWAKTESSVLQAISAATNAFNQYAQQLGANEAAAAAAANAEVLDVFIFIASLAAAVPTGGGSFALTVSVCGALAAGGGTLGHDIDSYGSYDPFGH
jgi:hypothetical protein